MEVQRQVLTARTGLVVEHRPSESPYIERVWRSRSYHVARMLVVANPHLHRSLRRYIGRTATELRGEAAEPPSLLYTT